MKNKEEIKEQIKKARNWGSENDYDAGVNEGWTNALKWVLEEEKRDD